MRFEFRLQSFHFAFQLADKSATDCPERKCARILCDLSGRA
jgi:hypothetical protein